MSTSSPSSSSSSSSKYHVKFDIRERDLIQMFEQTPELTWKWSPVALDIGDIQIFHTGPETASQAPLVIIERKTLADLAASIKDGRYREQKMRLKSFREKTGCVVIYLFEGVLGSINKHISRKTFNSCCLNTIVRDRISVLRTDGIMDTFEQICQLINNAQEWELSNQCAGNAVSGGAGAEMGAGAGAGTAPGSSQDEEYAATIKQKKKANLTPDVCYLSQLAAIPGVSTAIAAEIKKTYPTIVKLVERLAQPDGASALKDIMVGGRRIGDVRAARICKYMGGGGGEGVE